MAAFLFKTEPGDFSYDDLERAGVAVWDGVSNAAALIHLRTARDGDEVFIYHTGDERAIVGLARVVGQPFEDPAQPGKNDRGEPRAAVVKLAPMARAARPMTLATIKADTRFASFPLVTQGRLSVMPVPESLAKLIRAATGLKR